MKKINILFMCLSFWMLTSLQSQAQTPFSLLWNFTGATTGATASTPPAGLTVGNMTIGNTLGTVTAISSTSASTGYTGASGTNNIGNASVTGALNTATSAYVQVVITPSAGDVFTFTGISLATRSTTTGPQAYAIRTSIDNYATTVASNTITNNSTWSFTSNTFTNPVATAAGSPITIRIYGYNGTGSAGSNTINWRLDDITISGTVGSATNPTLGTSVTALNFGSKCINTTSIDSFIINGNNLNSATNIDVAALSGFQYSTSINGTYANNLSLTQAGGSYSQKVYIQYQPTVAIAYNGAVSISGGGVTTPISLNITATGISTPPSVSAQAASSITTSDAVLNASGIAAGCGTISNYYFEYSTTQNFTAGTGTTVAGNNLSSGNFSVALSNLNSSTTYYYKAFVTNSNGVTTPSTEMSFTTLSLAPTLTVGTLASFGNQCLNTASAGLALNIAGSNLQSGSLQIGPATDFKFSLSSTGVYEDSLIIAQSGGSFNQNIYVSFIPSTLGTINGTINVIGGGAPQGSTSATGTGINTIPTLSTVAPISISYNGAVLQGQVTAANCGTITAYGIEWGTSSTLASGTTLTASSNMAANVFTSSLLGLNANTTYYYRAYAVSTYGTSYSSILSFTTSLAPGSFLWNFTGSTTGATATTVPTGVTVGNMTIGNSNGTISGAFINSTSPSSGYVGASATNNIGNAAITGALNTATSAYVQVVITPDMGMMYSLNAISLGARSTTTGPQRYAIRTSLDNYATSLDTGVIPNTGTWVLRSNTFSNPVSVIDGTPLTIRIYGYGGSGNAATGTINWRLDDIILTGSLVSSTNPNLTLSSASLNFGSKCINNNYVDSFTVNGTNLDAAYTVDIAPLNGFSYATSLNGTYSNQLNIPQTGGAFSQKVYVQFSPINAIAYNGQIAVTGGGYTSTLNVNTTASGISTPPSVSAAAATNITASSATLNASSVVAGCGTISSYSFEYSTVSGFAAGTGTVVTSSNLAGGNFSAPISGLNPITTYYYKATVINSNGVASTSIELSFTTFNLTPVLSASTLSTFGNQCINTLSTGSALTLSGVNLTIDPIQVGPTADFKFSETFNGTYADSLVLTQAGGTYNQTVYVAFIPSTVGSVNASIQINGGGASTTVAATGSGINTLPVVMTNTPISIAYNGAVLSGTITALNCGTVSSYGFEWGTDANLLNASTLNSSNLSSGNFTADLLNLTANTTYYFRSFLVASNGTVTSAISSFQTAQIPAPTGLSATNVTTNSFVANWNQVLSVTNYRLDVSTNSNFWGTPIALLGFNFNAQTNIPTSGVTLNASQSLSTVGANAPTFNAGGNGGFTARADGWNSGNGTKYWQTSFATTGYGNITVSSKQRSSNSGPKNFKLQYRVGNTGNFSDVPNATITTADEYITGVLNNVVLPSECNDQPLVFVRWIMTSNTSVNNLTVTSTGASNIDDILINGSEASFVANYNNKLVTALNDTVTGLNPNTNYYFRVRAEETNSLSANSATQSVLTSCVTPTFAGTITNASCSGNLDGAIALSIPSAANYTYSWTGANGFSATTKDISALAPGVYYVSVVAGACSASDSFTISAPAPLVATATASDDTVCLGATVDLNAIVSGGTGSYNYLWFGPNGFYNATSNPSFATTLADAGNYMLIVTDANNCSANANVSFEVSAGYADTTYANACDSYFWSVSNQTYTNSDIYYSVDGCITHVLILNVTPSTSTYSNVSACVSYTWPVTGLTYAQSGIFTSVSNCHVDTLDLTINTNVPAQISASGSLAICSGGTVTLSVGNAASYLWSNGATSSTITVNAAAAGNYSVTTVDSAGCIGNSDTVQIIAKTMPSTVKIKTVGLTSVCDPNTVLFTVDPSAANLYGFDFQWNLNGTPITGATDTTYIASGVGGGSVTLTVSGSTCTKTSAAKTYTIKPLPVATFTAGGPTTICAGQSVTLTAPTITGYTYTWLNNGVSAGSGASKVFKVAGVFTVIAKLNGCSDTSNNSVNIVVNPLPVAGITALTPATFCAGDSCTMQATPSGATTYAWINGTTTVTTSVNTYATTIAGTFKMMVTDANGCISKVTTTSVKTKVNPIPVASISASTSTTIAANGSVKLNASPSSGVTFQWYMNGSPISGATTKQYIATAGGSYTVAITKSGCTGTSAATTVTQTGVKEEAGITSNPTTTEEAVFELAAYPNPVSGVLTINVRGIDEVNATVQVMDFNGRVVAMKEMNATSTTVDMTGYASGVYLIRYKDAEGRTGTIKITKE